MSLRAAAALLCVVALAGCSVKDNDPTAAPPDVASPPADALRTKTGIASKVLQVGLGSEHPTLQSTLTVHYTGWTPDGKMFDSSIPRNEPITFTPMQVIEGWRQGLQLMLVGEKRRFWIPGNLAYGELVPGGPTKTPDGSPLGMLVFDIELIKMR